MHVAPGSPAQPLPKARAVGTAGAPTQLLQTRISRFIARHTHTCKAAMWESLSESQSGEYYPWIKSFLYLFCTHPLHNAKGELRRESSTALPEMRSDPDPGRSARCQWWGNCPTKHRPKWNTACPFSACQWNEENVTLLTWLWYCSQLVLCHDLPVTKQKEGWLD